MPIALFYTKTPVGHSFVLDNISFNLDDNASGDREGDCRLTTKIM